MLNRGGANYEVRYFDEHRNMRSIIRKKNRLDPPWGVVKKNPDGVSGCEAPRPPPSRSQIKATTSSHAASPVAYPCVRPPPAWTQRRLATGLAQDPRFAPLTVVLR